MRAGQTDWGVGSKASRFGSRFTLLPCPAHYCRHHVAGFGEGFHHWRVTARACSATCGSLTEALKIASKQAF